MKKIYGQQYSGHYLKFGEKREVSGILTTLDEQDVLVNENNQWIPFEKVKEAQAVGYDVAAHLKEKIFAVLNEEGLNAQVIEDLFNSDAVDIKLNPDMVEEFIAEFVNGDSVAEIEDEVTEDVSEEVGEDVTPDLPEPEEEEDSDEGEETEEQLMEGFFKTIDLEMKEMRMREMTATEFVDLAKQRDKLVNLVAGLKNKAGNEEDPAKWPWLNMVGPVKMNHVQISKLSKALESEAERQRNADRKYSIALTALQAWVNTGISEADRDAAEAKLRRSATTNDIQAQLQRS